MHHGTLPSGGVAVVLGGALPIPVLIAILLWVFPGGRLPPGRWRPVFIALAVAGVLLGLAAGLAPGIAAVASHHIRGLASGNLNPPTGGWAIIANVTNIAAVVSLLVWLVVQVPSYRRSGDERRQQLKWLYSGATVYALVIVAGFLVPPALGEPVGYDGPVINDLIELASALLIVCIGVAVLKYPLYEIDRIISRVISYAIITAVLAGVFAGVVVLATEAFPFKTPVAVAASTLVAAALFNPLRRASRTPARSSHCPCRSRLLTKTPALIYDDATDSVEYFMSINMRHELHGWGFRQGQICILMLSSFHNCLSIPRI